MVNLSTNPMNRYYFVKDKVIFKIDSTNQDGDICGSKHTEELPKLGLKKQDTSSETDTPTYYLDQLIQCGDLFEEGAFKHVNHGDDSEEEILFDAYFKNVCEDEIKMNAVKKNLTFTDVKKNPSKLGVPLWMLTVDSEQVDPKYKVDDIQINITQDSFDTYKREGLVEIATEQANNFLKQYGYKVKTLEIEGLGE